MINRAQIPGIGATVAIALLAFSLTKLAGLGSVEVFALLFGFILANVISLPQKLNPGIQFSEKKILGWAIALMGFQLSFAKLNITWWLIPVIILAMFLAIGLGSKVSKKFGVLNTCGYMIGVGTAICGASAIAAVSPLLSTRPHETGVAVGVVNLLGTAGMVLLPMAVIALGFDANEAGVLIGGSLQAVGQVVGAGYAVGDVAGEVATLVKLGRVLMLGPVVIFTALIMHKQSAGVDRKKVLPGFIIAFVVFLIIANVFSLPQEWLGYAKWLDKLLLTVAMAAIGMQIRLRDLLKQGPKALLLGSAIFAVQLGLMFAFIYGQRFFS